MNGAGGRNGPWGGSGDVAGDDGKVRGGEVEREEVGRPHPTEREVFMRVRGGAGGSEAADKREQFDPQVAVVVEDGREGADDGGVAAEFLAEFAAQGGFRGLAGFDFAAGEFPLEREVFVRRALGDEDGAGGVFDDGTGDRKGSLDHHGAGRKRGGVAGTIPGVGVGGDFRRRAGGGRAEIPPGSWPEPCGTIRGRFEDGSRTVRGRFGGGSAVRPRRRTGRGGRAGASAVGKPPLRGGSVSISRRARAEGALAG